ncbi:MAG TPA: glycosyltransferase family 2 protein [Anaerolineae bacterium]
MSIRRLVRKWFVDGKLRGVGATLYNSLIAVELAWQRVLDVLPAGGKTQDQALVNRHLTAVVKTFERPQVLRRLLAGIQREYPSLQVIVVDDSRAPVRFDGVRTIVMPYDSGVSAGRNEGLKQVATKYVLVLDDDFVFYRHTALEPALALMERHPEIDIMGGQVVDLPFFETTDYRTAALWPTEAKPTLPPGSRIGGLPVYDKVANFFIGRTDRIRLVSWEPALKRLDHADFFTRAKGVLTTVFNPDLVCLHARTPFDDAYMQKRTDYVAETALLKFMYNRARYVAYEDGKKTGKERD